MPCLFILVVFTLFLPFLFALYRSEPPLFCIAFQLTSSIQHLSFGGGNDTLTAASRPQANKHLCFNHIAVPFTGQFWLTPQLHDHIPVPNTGQIWLTPLSLSSRCHSPTVTFHSYRLVHWRCPERGAAQRGMHSQPHRGSINTRPALADQAGHYPLNKVVRYQRFFERPNISGNQREFFIKKFISISFSNNGFRKACCPSRGPR